MLWPLQILAWLYPMACISHFSPFCILAGIITCTQAHLVSKATDRQQTFAQLRTPDDLLFAAYACMSLWYARLSWRVSGAMCNTLPLRSTVSQCTFMSRDLLPLEAKLCATSKVILCSWCNVKDNFISYGRHASNSCDWSQLMSICLDTPMNGTKML